MINLAIVLLFLSLVLEILVGVTDDCVDGSECWKIVVVTWRL
jgi:hypothetical protein